MKHWFTAAEMAKLALPGLPRTERAFQIAAQRESWSSRQRAGRGGGYEYHISSLPEAARLVLAGRAAAEAAKRAPDLPATRPAPAPQSDPRYLTGQGQLRLDAKLSVLSAWDAFWPASGLKQLAAQHKFAGLYTAGEIAVEGWVRKAEPRLSATSLRRWLAYRAAGDWAPLAGRYEGRRGQGAMARSSDDIRGFLGGVIAKQPQLSAANVRKILIQQFGPTITVMIDGEEQQRPMPSLRQVQREITTWRKANKQALRLVTDPDGWRNTHMVAIGDADEDIVRPNQRWEIDASPADMLCVDGRWSIYVAIDVYTRRVMVYISRTPRTEAALLLIRRAILSWGVPESIRTDQGSDFISVTMRRALTLLGIHHDDVAAFSPDRKAFVERHIGYLQHDLMPLLPGFIGHSVADRKAIEGRKSFAQRLGETPEKLLQVSMTGEDLQVACDYWAQEQYSYRPHDGLSGRTPAQVTASYTGDLRRIGNERALDQLLAPAPTGGATRTVGKKGIQVENTFFWDTALIPYVGTGERLDIRLDPEDMGRLYVYREDPWEFVCVAVDPDRLGLDRRQMAIHAKAEQKTWVKGVRADLRSASRRFQPHRIAQAMLQSGTTLQEAAGEISYSTPALAAAKAAANDRPRTAGPVTIRELDPDTVAAADRLWAEMEGEDSASGTTTESDDPIVVSLQRPTAPASATPRFATDEDFALWALANPKRATPGQLEYLSELMANRAFRDLLDIKMEALERQKNA